MPLNSHLQGSRRPRFEEVVNGPGHSNVRARWVGGKKTGFIQLGDVIDRSDHSELACEILRQLILARRVMCSF